MQAGKWGSRTPKLQTRLVLQMVGIGAERQQSTSPDRFGYCRAIARHSSARQMVRGRGKIAHPYITSSLIWTRLRQLVCNRCEKRRGRK